MWAGIIDRDSAMVKVKGAKPPGISKLNIRGIVKVCVVCFRGWICDCLLSDVQAVVLVCLDMCSSKNHVPNFVASDGCLPCYRGSSFQGTRQT
jgi:hypothetical protein